MVGLSENDQLLNHHHLLAAERDAFLERGRNLCDEFTEPDRDLDFREGEGERRNFLAGEASAKKCIRTFHKICNEPTIRSFQFEGPRVQRITTV